MYTIYKITNNINGKRYIGFTIQNPLKRWAKHKRNSKKLNRVEYLYCAIRKYGAENFSCDVLAWGEDHNSGLKVAEPLMIELFRPEYNMTKGGDGTVGLCAEARTRHSNSLKHSPKAIEWREKLHAMRVGVPHSLLHRQRISAKMIGIPKPTRSKEHRENHRATLIGVPKQKTTCPHCNAIGGVPQMKQWHFDNCKVKGF